MVYFAKPNWINFLSIFWDAGKIRCETRTSHYLDKTISCKNFSLASVIEREVRLTCSLTLYFNDTIYSEPHSKSLTDPCIVLLFYWLFWLFYTQNYLCISIRLCTAYCFLSVNVYVDLKKKLLWPDRHLSVYAAQWCTISFWNLSMCLISHDCLDQSNLFLYGNISAPRKLLNLPKMDPSPKYLLAVFLKETVNFCSADLTPH